LPFSEYALQPSAYLTIIIINLPYTGKAEYKEMFE